MFCDVRPAFVTHMRTHVASESRNPCFVVALIGLRLSLVLPYALSLFSLF